MGRHDFIQNGAHLGVASPCLTVEPVFSTNLRSSFRKNLMISTKITETLFCSAIIL
jgi:hypothetical protein